METCPAYVSKFYLNYEKQIIFLRIPNEEKEGWHNLAEKIACITNMIKFKKE